MMYFGGKSVCMMMVILPSLSACSSGSICMKYLPDNLSTADDQTILNANVAPEQLFKFNRCRVRFDDEAAQYRLALAYEEGVGVEQNFDTAVRWYKKAADEKSGLKWVGYGKKRIAMNVGPEVPGHPIAQYRLGMMYLDGRGVKKNDSIGRLWIGRSAEQGYEFAVEKERDFIGEHIKWPQ